MQIVSSSAIVLQEWNTATSLAAGDDDRNPVGRGRHVDGIQRCLAWNKPTVGFMKINVDATFFKDLNQTGLGMVIRDELRIFVLTRTKIVPGR